MASNPKIDISTLLDTDAKRTYYEWVLEKNKESLTDKQIIDAFQIEEIYCTEDDIRFVEWVLYFLKLSGIRNLPAEEEPLGEESAVIDDEEHSEAQTGESDEFDKMLDDFLKNALKATEVKHGGDPFDDWDDDDEDDDDEEEEEDEDDDDEDQNRITPEVVRFSVDANSTCTQTSDYHKAFFLFKNDRYLHIEFRYALSDKQQGMRVAMRHFRCHTILEQVVDADDMIANEGVVTITFDIEELIPRRQDGVDKLEVTFYDEFDSSVLIRHRFELICADSIFDAVRINALRLYSGYSNSDPMMCDTNTSYIGFRQSDLRQLNLYCFYTPNIDGFTKSDAMAKCRVYDQTGRMVAAESIDIYDSSDNRPLLLACGLGREFSYEWESGTYRLELSILDVVVATTSFRVGEASLEGETDVNQMTSQLRALISEQSVATSAQQRLGELIGLESVKQKIASLSKIASLAQKRRSVGLPSKSISLHARFVGNPGTGKTTVAEIVGQIYKELGLLSKGHVVRVERRNLVGRFYDSELRATEQALESARGGVLFIDEAYSLYVAEDPKDPGHKVIETLLTALSDESQRDWMLVLAGYPDEIENMMNSNPGLKSRVNETFFFDDYNVDELMQIADLYCKRNEYILEEDARKHLHSVVTRAYNSRDKMFGNARYVSNLMEQTVLANMSQRLGRIEEPTKEQLQTIVVEDIPSTRNEGGCSRGMEGLNNMVGLSNIKRNITQHLNMVKLANMRMKLELHTEMPPLHMIFTGNPGTGKTTVADFLGEIYASMGLLSKGDVIRVEKRDLVGEHVGETEQKMKSILARAAGNILFIDEAYQLCAKDGQNDYGKIVMESLLTTLSNDSIDMIVILAGYPADMERLLDMNEGLRSRFPYVLHFEDYSVDELMNIALQRAKRDNYEFSPKAKHLLRALIKREALRKRSSFGNGRFVTRLLSTEILPRMATRLAASANEPTLRQLKTIIAEDIPITAQDAARVERGAFDNEAIDAALQRLDALVGQDKVKRAIHNFVDVSRHLNSEGERFVGRGFLKWNFAGNSGTGKSTVAEILADILKAMNLLDKGNIVEVRGEQIFNVSEYQCDAVLRQAMERSRYGLLFIDGDAPEFRQESHYRMTSEQLRIKLTSLTAEIGGTGAVVIAECNSPRQTVANTLAMNGIYDFDHTFFFDDYSSEELFEILSRRLEKHKVRFSPEAEAKMRAFIDSLCANRNLSFANARTMKHLARTIYEQVILREIEDKSSPRKVVLLEDVESYNWQQSRKLGY